MYRPLTGLFVPTTGADWPSEFFGLPLAGSLFLVASAIALATGAAVLGSWSVARLKRELYA